MMRGSYSSRPLVAFCCALATVSCGQSAGSGEETPQAGEAPIVTAQTVVQESPVPIADGLLDCTDSRGENSFSRIMVVAVGNRFKAYSEDRNLAADICPASDDQCFAGWQDGKAVRHKIAANYGKFTEVFDFEAGTQQKWFESLGEGGEDTYKLIECEKRPLPDGMMQEYVIRP